MAPDPCLIAAKDRCAGARLVALDRAPGLIAAWPGAPGLSLRATPDGGMVLLGSHPAPPPWHLSLTLAWPNGRRRDDWLWLMASQPADRPAAFGPEDWTLHPTEDGTALTLAALPAGEPTATSFRLDGGPWRPLGPAALGQHRLPHAARVELRAETAAGPGPSSARGAPSPPRRAETIRAESRAALDAALATIAANPGQAIDWTILCAPFTSAAPLTLGPLSLAGSLTDPNRSTVAQATRAADILQHYDRAALPRMAGGSLTLRAQEPGLTVFSGAVTVQDAGPLCLDGLAFTRRASAAPPEARGRVNRAEPAVRIRHRRGARAPEVWFHACRFGAYDAASNAAPKDAETWVTALDVETAETVALSDCWFDGVFNCAAFRHTKTVLRLRTRIGPHRVNDVWSHVQSRAETTLEDWQEKRLTAVGEIAMPPVFLPVWGTAAHSDYHQIGAVTDDRDYTLLLLENRVASEQGIFASATFPTDRIGVRGWILGNLIASENSHAITPGPVRAGDRLVIEANTCVKWSAGPERRAGYAGLRSEALLRVFGPTEGEAGVMEVRGNILGGVAGPGGALATSDRRLPRAPRPWAGTGAALLAEENAYLPATGDRAPAAYQRAFAGPFRRETDGLGRRTLWTWDTSGPAAFARSVDRLFRPWDGGPAAGAGHLGHPRGQSPGEPGPPDGFAAGDWSLRDLGLGARLALRLHRLPAANLGAIEAVEIRRGTGPWEALPGAPLQRAHWVAGVAGRPTRVALRARNRFGAGPAGPSKTATPTAAARPPGAINARDWSLRDAGEGGRLLLTLTALPEDGGAALTGLEIAVAGQPGWQPLGRVALGRYRIGGLTDGAPVTLTLRALNAVGAGPESAAKTATPTAGRGGPAASATLAQAFARPGAAALVTDPLAASGAANQGLLVLVGMEDTDGTLGAVQSVSWGDDPLTPLTTAAAGTLNRAALFARPIGARRGAAPLRITLSDGVFTQGQVVLAAILPGLAQTDPTALAPEVITNAAYPLSVRANAPGSNKGPDDRGPDWGPDWGSEPGLLLAGWLGSGQLRFRAETGVLVAEIASRPASVSAALQARAVAGEESGLLRLNAEGPPGRAIFTGVWWPRA